MRHWLRRKESAMSESMREPRTLTMSIRGEFINDLALEKCHLDYDICYAVDLLMSSLQTDQLSDGERLRLALRVLNGEVEIQGTYPGDDYGPVELETRNERYDLRATLTFMKDKMAAQAKEINQLNKKLACCGEQLDSYGMRKANRAWKNEWGEDGKIFSGIENSILASETSGLVEEFLERAKRPDSDQDYGWLEPTGVFHAVPFGEHQGWAWKKALELGFSGEAFDRGLGGDVLLEHGWVLLDNPGMGLARPTISDTKPLTKAQREFLFDYYTERDWPDLAKKYLEEG